MNVVTDGQIQNCCPVDLHPLLPVSASDEVRAVVAKARAAQPAWESLGFEKRASILKLAGRRMLEHREEVLELLHDETGKTPAESLMSEAIGPLQYINDWIRVARPWLRARKLPISPLAFPRKRGVIEMLPRGVAGVITSWNFPLGNFFRPVFAALLCGNAVVVKPSEFSPRTAEWFVKMMSEVLPPGILGLVQGDREAGQALIRSGIDAITFTGSFKSGKDVARCAAEQMIPCSVELGGKDAAIVLSDCDLDRTVAGIMYWALHNGGQACAAIERVYVEESIADLFTQRLATAVSALRVKSGDPQTSDVGPSAHVGQLEIVEAHVADAVACGAKICCGGTRVGKGLWFEPTVLDDCNHSMLVMKEPTFGPTIPIMRVKNAEEAVHLVNECEYGLNASVWSHDIKRAERLARQLQVGTAYVNNHAFTGAMPAAPWTGVKKSGHGVANSVFALQHYTRPRTVVVDRKKSADGWWFPMDSLAEEMGQRLALAQLGHVFSALKIPLLMARRQRAAMLFAREGDAAIKARLEPGGLERLYQIASHTLATIKTFVRRVGRKVLPDLTARELAWGQAAIETVFSDSKPSPLKPLSRSEAQSFLRDFYAHMPFPANLGVRASICAVGLAPIFRYRKWVTFDRLTTEKKLEVMDGFAESKSYLMKQIAFMIKMSGGLSHASTTRFHAAITASASKRSPEVRV